MILQHIVHPLQERVMGVEASILPVCIDAEGYATRVGGRAGCNRLGRE